MTVGTIDFQHPAEVLAAYRKSGHSVILDQARNFRTLSPSDQRELLFHMVPHETVVLNRLTQQMEKLCPKK